MDNLELKSTGQRGKRGFPRSLWLVLVCVLVLYFVSTRSVGVPDGWHTDYEAALSEAAANREKLLVAFHMEWCPPCSAMKRTVLSARAVESALEGYVAVFVDVDDRPDLANRFEVLGTPTYAVVDESGRLLAKCEGYQPADAFVSFLERASTVSLPGDISAEELRPSGP